MISLDKNEKSKIIAKCSNLREYVFLEAVLEDLLEEYLLYEQDKLEILDLFASTIKNEVNGNITFILNKIPPKNIFLFERYINDQFNTTLINEKNKSCI